MWLTWQHGGTAETGKHMIDPVIFKANDIRGVVGVEWDVDDARLLGAAFADAFTLTGRSFVLGRDMRASGEQIAQAFAEGAAARGAHPVLIGLSSTDQLWFASGHRHVPGVQITASHNPAQYNGVKFCLADAAPITPELMASIKAQALAGQPFEPVAEPGTIRHEDLLDAYVEHLLRLVPLDGMRHLRVVVDAGNGMGGYTSPAVLGRLDVELVGLFLELDGSFPNHQPNPLEPENLVDAQRAVREHEADLALVFDGDADRCFVIDERGEVVSPSVVTALIAAQELDREPGATIVVNTITSRTVAEVVAERGGRLEVSPVGHTYVKALMARHDAVFGGEHSAHYYFRDFWGADTGMLAGLHVLSMLGRSDQTLSELAAAYDRYHASGEINSTVAYARASMEVVAAAFEGRGTIDWTDGLRVLADDWWLSLRPSNTEPLLRLNVEAKDEARMADVRDEVLGLVRPSDD